MRRGVYLDARRMNGDRPLISLNPSADGVSYAPVLHALKNVRLRLWLQTSLQWDAISADEGQIAIPKVMKLKTFADVRDLLSHLPSQVRRKDTWRHVEDHLAKAAHGGDLSDMSVALQLVFSMKGIECDA
jgi:hypothetical protein